MRADPTPGSSTSPRPTAPIFRAIVAPVQAFFRLEAASGLVLLGAAAAALLWANLAGEGYHAFVEAPIAIALGPARVAFTLHALVNDGLMTLFFFVVGMEIKHELALGELRSPAQAALPLVAALGGMIAPAALYLAFNAGGPGAAGWGMPMATDIAFAVGVLTLLRSRVPHALVVFVTALAIFDDIGGILVIALFYGSGLVPLWLLAAAAISAALVLLGRAGVRSGALWAAGGILLWVACHEAGIHATIAGVVVGLAVPARASVSPREVIAALSAHAASLAAARTAPDLDAEEIRAIENALEDRDAPLGRFTDLLHPWVAFGVMPLFALLNSGVEVAGGAERLAGAVALGTGLGLVAGKLGGIFVFTAVAVKAGLAPLPGGASWAKLAGVSLVAGIGFTVALFIAGLAFPDSPALLDEAKAGILVGSLAAGVAGAIVLRATPAVR